MTQLEKITKVLNQVRANLESRGVFTENSVKEKYLEACRKKAEDDEKELVIARLKTLPPDKKLSIG